MVMRSNDPKSDKEIKQALEKMRQRAKEKQGAKGPGRPKKDDKGKAGS